MQSPRNPTRRNRNIGTAAQGHGQDNSLVIPAQTDGPYWLDRVGDCQIQDHRIGDKDVRFVIEENALQCTHPCTVADVLHILASIPQSDWAGLQTFVFRQPTRKQLTLDPVWGRLLYHADITNAKGQVLAEGPTILLHAVNVGKTLVWSTSLDPDDAQELERLKEDGHEVQRSGRKFHISLTAQSARNTQLYRTLLHELGHWFDWLSKVEEPASRGEDWDELASRYFARPNTEREAFAHCYADAQRKQLEAKGVIQFDTIG